MKMILDFILKAIAICRGHEFADIELSTVRIVPNLNFY